MTLTEFLLARIAEVEAHHGPLAERATSPYDEPHRRWLAECEAKRRLVDNHGGRHICEDSLAGERWDEDLDAVVDWPCDDLRIIGAIYAAHPDYREEWKP